MRLLGNAAIVWSSTDGDRTLELRAPLRAVTPEVKRNRWVRESLDFSTRSVTTVGDGVHEVVGTIRYSDAPQSLVDMLLFGQGGGTLTYIPDVTNQAVSHDVLLIEPEEMPRLDTDRGEGFEELEVQVRLRRTDGAPFAPIP